MHAVLAGGSLGASGGQPPKLNAGQQLPGSTPSTSLAGAAPGVIRPGSSALGAQGSTSGQATTGVSTTTSKGQPATRGVSAPGQMTSTPAGPLSPGTEPSWTSCPTSLQERETIEPDFPAWPGRLAQLMLLQLSKASVEPKLLQMRFLAADGWVHMQQCEPLTVTGSAATKGKAGHVQVSL